jgi:thiamine biosynthesis lipoprotein
MGSTCRIGVWSAPDGPDPDQLLTDAVRLVDDLEAAWSRFRVDSELTRINRHAGIAVPVSQATLDLVALAVAAWERTDGRFDPTVGDAVVAAGYDRTFSELGIDGPPTTRQPTRVPGCSGIVVDHAGGTVTVPTGMRLDLGGIGKGRAADLTATLLAEAGALGAVVDLGGDVRTIGVAPEADQWVITVRQGGAARRAAGRCRTHRLRRPRRAACRRRPPRTEGAGRRRSGTLPRGGPGTADRSRRHWDPLRKPCAGLHQPAIH